MIAFVTGVPGAGKGYYTVTRIEEALKSSDHAILTNFALELQPWVRRLGRRRTRGEKGFLAYLQDKYGETFDAEKRIHILTDEQIQHFFLYRVKDDYSLVKIDAEIKDGRVIGLTESAFQDYTMPCYYIIDEAWKFWNARNWQKIDGGFQAYNAQHRKAGDNMDICCQAAAQIDKQARILVQEFHTLVNHGYRKMAFFRQPNVISVVVSNEPPEARKSLGAMPKIMRIDKVGIGGSFDTAKGAGVRGTGADIERKKKGLPAWGVFVLVILLGGGLIFGARGMGWAAGKLLTGGFTEPVKKPIEDGVKTMSAPWSPPAPSGGVGAVAPREHNQKSYTPVTNAVYIAGWAVFNKPRILISDGRILSPGDVGVQAFNLQEGWIQVNGERIWTKEKANN